MSFLTQARPDKAPDVNDLLPGYSQLVMSVVSIGGTLYAVLAVMHLLVLDGDLRDIMFPLAASTSLFLFGVRTAYWLRMIGEQHVKDLSLLTIGLSWLNCSVHLWASGDPIQSTNLAILVIGSGFIMMNRSEFAAIIAACFLSWIAAFALAGTEGIDQHWVHYGLHLAEAVTLAVATYYWKMVALKRNFMLRQEQASLREAERLAMLAAQSKAVEAEQNLRRALEADASKSMFLASMSHELRTPLNSVVGFAQLLKERSSIAANPALVSEYAACIQSSGTHLLGVINQVLDFSRANAGAISLTECEVNVSDTLHEITRLLAPLASEAQVALSVSCSRDPVVLLADDLRLRQVATNILANALKFTPRGGSVIASVLLRDGCAVLEVCDTGVGIALKDQARVFEPFVQAEGGMNKSHQGTGLGLPITKKLVELHGGTIAMKSALGEGTTIIITFPAERTRRHHVPQKQTA